MTAPTIAVTQATTGTAATLPASGTVNVSVGDLLIVALSSEDGTPTIAQGSSTTARFDKSPSSVITFYGGFYDASTNPNANNDSTNFSGSNNFVNIWSTVCTTAGTFSATASGSSTARRWAFYVVTPPSGHSWLSNRIIAYGASTSTSASSGSGSTRTGGGVMAYTEGAPGSPSGSLTRTQWRGAWDTAQGGVVVTALRLGTAANRSFDFDNDGSVFEVAAEDNTSQRGRIAKSAFDGGSSVQTATQIQMSSGSETVAKAWISIMYGSQAVRSVTAAARGFTKTNGTAQVSSVYVLTEAKVRGFSKCDSTGTRIIGIFTQNSKSSSFSRCSAKAAPYLQISSIQMVAQETGPNELIYSQNTGGQTLAYELSPLAVGSGGHNKWSGSSVVRKNATENWNAFAADLGFAWDAGNNSDVLIAFGDTFGGLWRGTDVNLFANNTVTSVASGSNNVDVSIFTGSGEIFVSNDTPFSSSGGRAIIRFANTGQYAVVKYTGKTTGKITGVQTIVGSGVLTTGSNIGQSDIWSDGSTSNSQRGWRSQTLAVSSTVDLKNGYIIDDFRPKNATGSANELLSSKKDTDPSNSSHRVYSSSSVLTISEFSISGFIGTIKTTTPHGITDRGTIVLVSGINATYNQEYTVWSIPSADTIKFVWFTGDVSFTNTGQLRAPSNITALQRNPQASTGNTVGSTTNEVTIIPTGGLSVAGVGSGGATRQYLYFFSTSHWPSGPTWGSLSLTNYMGIGYSDDTGQTWQKASASSYISGFDNSNISSTTYLDLTNASAFPTSGTAEVDTSELGLAYLRWTGKSGNRLTGVSLVRGSGSLAQNVGIRYAMWANNATFTDKTQQAWPLKKDGFVYLMAAPCHRWGPAYMARVAEADVLDISAYRYWNGIEYVEDKSAISPIFGDTNSFASQDPTTYYRAIQPVGEPSFLYQEGNKCFVTTYLEDTNGRVVMRSASRPEGPWSTPQTLIDGTIDFPNTGIYGGMVHPWSSRSPNNANDLFFHVSLWDPYATVLMRSRLSGPIAFFPESDTTAPENFRGCKVRGFSNLKATIVPVVTGAARGFSTAKVSSIIAPVTANARGFSLAKSSFTAIAFLNPTGLNSTETFGATSVLPGEVTLSPSSIVSGESLGSVALTPGLTTIAPLSLSSNESIGSATLVAGQTTIVPSGLSSTVSVGVALLQPGQVLSSPSGLSPTVSFGEATLVAGQLTISVVALDSTLLLGSAALTSGVTNIEVASIASTTTLGSPVLSPGPVVVLAPSIDPTTAVGAVAVIVGGVSVSPSGISSTSVLGVPTVASQSSNITASSISSNTTIGQPSVVAGQVILFTSALSPTSTFGLAGLVLGATTIQSSSIQTTLSIGIPYFIVGNYSISVSSLASSATFGVTSVYSGISFVYPNSLPSTVTFGSPSATLFKYFKYMQLSIFEKTTLLEVKSTDIDNISVYSRRRVEVAVSDAITGIINTS